MSVSVKGTTITMTRGDTARIAVSITRGGDVYTPVNGDTIRFAAKHAKMKSNGRQFADEEPVIRIDIPIDTMMLEIAPEDTASLDFDSYTYDIQITFADGAVDTFIKEATLTLTPEVE